MILRPASLDDLPALVALGRESFSHAFGSLYTPEDLAAFLDEHRSTHRFAAYVSSPDASVTLAEGPQGLMGYCLVAFGARFDERPAPHPRSPCVLSELYCAGSATGGGIGTALIEDALAKARLRGCDAVQLSVYCDNLGAQRFYERFGFRKVADIDFWVGNHRDDEFLLELAL